MHTKSTAYAPPKTVSRPAEPRAGAPRLALAALLTLAPLGALAITFGIFALRAWLPFQPSDDFFGGLFGLSAMLALIGVGISAYKVFRLMRGGAPTRSVAVAIAAIPIGIVSASVGALAALMAVAEFTRGRQIRRRGKVMKAELEEDSDWIDATVAPVRSSAPAGVAEAWRSNGLTEHASVAAFARVSMELVALGAPPSLIEKAHRDALDEMQHTKICFELARAYDGRSLGPSDFPAVVTHGPRRGPRFARLAQLAVESLFDGALNEGVSARVVAELSKTCPEPRARAVLTQIAKDEARHALHGFEIAQWCLETGGTPVAIAIASARSLMPKALSPGIRPAAAEDGRWEAWGIPGRDREDMAFATVRARLDARLDRLLASAAVG